MNSTLPRGRNARGSLLPLLILLIALASGPMAAGRARAQGLAAVAPNGGRSAFGSSTLSGAGADYQVGAGSHGELTVFISGSGANITLPDIRQALKEIGRAHV